MQLPVDDYGDDSKSDNDQTAVKNVFPLEVIDIYVAV